ncbi:hypothetical protein JL721_7842 [Aureococcus anophagefferens]|nr:hypothetical protein JL721_7842 [Aureococcus anophagefferens]
MGQASRDVPCVDGRAAGQPLGSPPDRHGEAARGDDLPCALIPQLASLALPPHAAESPRRRAHRSWSSSSGSSGDERGGRPPARLPRYADLFSADDSLQRARRPRLQRPAPADRDDSDDADDEREPRNGAEAAARRELQRLGAPSRKRAYSADAPAAASAAGRGRGEAARGGGGGRGRGRRRPRATAWARPEDEGLAWRGATARRQLEREAPLRRRTRRSSPRGQAALRRPGARGPAREPDDDSTTDDDADPTRSSSPSSGR